MSPDELEQLLASAPTCRLPPDAERRILEAVLDAERTGRGWWARPIPLWQTAVACAAAVLLVLALARPTSPTAARVVGADRPNAAFVPVDVSWLGTQARPTYRTDITRWRQLEVKREGEPQP